MFPLRKCVLSKDIVDFSKKIFGLLRHIINELHDSRFFGSAISSML